MTWQLATLIIGLGGLVAAAGTGAGFRHGLFAGVLEAAGAVGLNAAQGVLNPPSTYWLNKLSLGGLAPSDPVAMAGVAIGVLIAALAGGILGGVLLPPLAPEHVRNRKLVSFG